MIVGLTGKICSGKDTFASMLPADRFTVIDVDSLGHKALENNRDRIRETFGDGVIGADGSVDRKALGHVVFSDPDKLEALNGITHPWMVEEALREARCVEKSGKVAVINAALLESMGFVGYCDSLVLVTAPYALRERRAAERSGLSAEEFRKRSDAQKDIGLSLFSSGKKVVTVINDSDKDSLSRQVSFYYDTIYGRGRL